MEEEKKEQEKNKTSFHTKEKKERKMLQKYLEFPEWM